MKARCISSLSSLSRARFFPLDLADGIAAEVEGVEAVEEWGCIPDSTLFPGIAIVDEADGSTPIELVLPFILVGIVS
jgi:hypothetical protein